METFHPGLCTLLGAEGNGSEGLWVRSKWHQQGWGAEGCGSEVKGIPTMGSHPCSAHVSLHLPGVFALPSLANSFQAFN